MFSLFLTTLFIFGLGIATKGFRESFLHQRPYGLTPGLFFAGIFVWGDAVVIGLFWSLLALISYFVNSWYFLGLGTSIFWLIRGWGEVQYWLHEQFAVHHRNEPKTLHFHRYFPDDSIWFVYQVFWQCLMVGALLLSLFFGWKLVLAG